VKLTRSVILDIFEKFDLHDLGGLKFKQVDNFVKRIQRKITEEDFRRMVMKYDFSNYFKKDDQGKLL
jgi:hypothetical protein